MTTARFDQPPVEKWVTVRLKIRKDLKTKIIIHKLKNQAETLDEALKQILEKYFEEHPV